MDFLNTFIEFYLIFNLKISNYITFIFFTATRKEFIKSNKIISRPISFIEITIKISYRFR